jgi:hypothetical protein
MEEPFTLANLRRALALLREQPNTPTMVEAAVEDAIQSFVASWREGAITLTHDEHGVPRSHWHCPRLPWEHPGV